MSVPSGPFSPWTYVLVASRDRVLARSLEATLQAHGADVHLWEGRGAWSVEAPQLDGIDVLLVEASGSCEAEWTLVEHVRERSPMVEIVAISEDPLVEGAVQALRNGVYTLLAYPVSDEQLVEAITQATARKRRGEQRIHAIDTQRGVEASRGTLRDDPL
jgi:DNA-binding NtrC family response regulator